MVTGLDSGADDYLTKPVDHAALTARVRSILRTKALHDTVQEQAAVATQAAELPMESDAGAARRRAARRTRARRPAQALPLAAAGRARGFQRAPSSFWTATAATWPSSFATLRGFTAFGEAAEPEEVMRVARGVPCGLGALIHHFEGTLERFPGDGLLVLFNDPMPCPDPAARAVRMAAAMRDRHLRARRALAEAGARAWLRHRDRARPGYAWPDRLRGSLRLRRDRHGRESRRPALRRSQAGPDPGQPTGHAGGRRMVAGQPCRRPADQGVRTRAVTTFCRPGGNVA